MAFRYLPLLLLVCCLCDHIAVKARDDKQKITKTDVSLGTSKEDRSHDEEEESVKSHQEHSACEEKIRQNAEYNSEEDKYKTDACSTRDDGTLAREGSEEGAKIAERKEVPGNIASIKGEKTGDVKDERTNEGFIKSSDGHYFEKHAELHEENKRHIRSKEMSTNDELIAKKQVTPPEKNAATNVGSLPLEQGSASFVRETEEERKNSAHNEAGEKRVSENPSVPPDGHLKKLGEHKHAEEDGAIEVLHYVPNGKDFYTHFLRKRRPLVMRGAAKNWGAVKHWSNETYLKEKYGGVIFDVEYRKIQSAAEYPIKKTMNMTEFLSLYKTIPMYLDSPFPQSNLTQDIFVPYCLQCAETFHTISSVHLLFSSGGTSSAFHQDGYDNLLTMISGRKEVVVIDSKYSEELYADDFETVPGLSPVNPEAVDLIKFPKVADVPFHKVILYPGDILFIPMHWWHHVRSYESPNIGITLWFFQFPANETEMDQDEYLSYKSVVEEGKRFDRQVERYPHTIECKNQNPSLGAYLNTARR